MTEKNYHFHPLPWDTEYFGINSARVNLSGIVDENGQAEILDFCKDYEFVTLSNHDNINENNHWIGKRTTAYLVDMNIQFLKRINQRPDHLDTETSIANNLSRNDKIIDISRNSFNYSRFFNDPQLPHLQAKQIYQHWTECAFDQKDKYFVISERAGLITGYILFSFVEDTSLIELIAVDKKHQGQKIGKSMIHALESYVLNQGIQKIKVGTQVNNIQAVQFYHAMGYKYAGCGSVYHWWGRH